MLLCSRLCHPLVPFDSPKRFTIDFSVCCNIFFSRHFVLETGSLYVVLTVQEDQTGFKLADPTGSIRHFLKGQ